MLNDLLNLLFPKLCFVCHNSLPKEAGHLCFGCKRNLPISGFPPSINNPTAKVFKSRPNLCWAYSLMEFTASGISQKILHALKYRNAQSVSSEIIKSEIFEPCFAAYNKPSAIVPIPLHPRKLALRGFNQAEAIAHCLSGILKIPAYPHLLQRPKFNKSQTKNNKYERHKLSSNLFIRVDMPPSSIILVDDVVTTGATLHSAMDCFPNSTDIAIFTLARA